ncbi:hypothetical protein SCA03_11790 [Streptomyces cacaoi]|uniref:Uncharacterized protein n=1 Tax=Streptomyces cacaoi TaxID=1898 RepID=A0A4Y3QW30_STRCI|nr:hypothetical protein SCA03_11790 [Streptomyces cacaoi]
MPRRLVAGVAGLPQPRRVPRDVLDDVAQGVHQGGELLLGPSGEGRKALCQQGVELSVELTRGFGDVQGVSSRAASTAVPLPLPVQVSASVRVPFPALPRALFLRRR